MLTLGIGAAKKSETEWLSNWQLEGGRGFILLFFILPNEGGLSFLWGGCHLFKGAAIQGFY